MQISEVSFKVCLVVLPRHSVHTWSRIAFQRKEQLAEQIDADVVQKRCELLLLPLPCGVPYASYGQKLVTA